MEKFNVVRVDGSNAKYYEEKKEGLLDCCRDELNCEILGTFRQHRDAVEFMAEKIDIDHGVSGGWKKIYHEKADTISVYHSGIMGGRYLICKYHILKYIDSTGTYCSQCGTECMELESEETIIAKL